MREFTPEYLEHTRRGMWESTAALEPLALDSRERVLDIGCGTGELSRVLAAESPGEVVGVDAATDLLSVASEQAGLPTVAGDATRLPFRDGVADLLVCQALLINLPDPAAAVREFARVSSDLVAAIEPNNAAVEVSSTVDAEERLEREVREAYLEGIETDVAMGERVADLFTDAGLDVVDRRTYHHEKLVEPPYSEAAMESAARKASGAGIAAHERELRAGGADYDDLRARWRGMGRDVVRAMGEEGYRRREVVPFEVTVARV